LQTIIVIAINVDSIITERRAMFGACIFFGVLKHIYVLLVDLALLIKTDLLKVSKYIPEYS
jgi:hypothetical protein